MTDTCTILQLQLSTFSTYEFFASCLTLKMDQAIIINPSHPIFLLKMEKLPQSSKKKINVHNVTIKSFRNNI